MTASLVQRFNDAIRDVLHGDGDRGVDMLCDLSDCYPPAANALGEIYRDGLVEEGADLEAATAWFLDAAARGDAWAAFNLGLMYQLGRGVERDPAEARHWYATAASHGLPGAYMNLGTLWECGAGGLQDHEEAAVCYARDAEQGVLEAQYRLGLLCLVGRGIERSQAMAYFWFMIAAAAGHEDAARQRDMAAAFMTPTELRKAQRAAREWWMAPPQSH